MKITRIIRTLSIYFVVFGVGIGAVAFINRTFFSQPMLSAVAPPIDTLHAKTSPSIQKETMVYGFLPYWNLKSAIIRKELTHVGYFSLTLNSDGSLRTRDGNEIEQGYSKFQGDLFNTMVQQARDQQQQIEIVITMMDADEISALLSNQQSKQRAISTIKSLAQTQPISGINIDIEYAGTVTDKLQESYLSFITELTETLKKRDPEFQVTIDVFADSARRYRIWDIEKIGKIVDGIIVMAYDFHRSSSTVSGPVSPLFGSESQKWDTDIMQNLKVFLEKVPSEKIILGIPFYGYEWQTTSDNPTSPTFPDSGGIATYKRVQALIRDEGVKEQWEKDAMTPYITYKEDGKQKIIFYENTQSLAYKMDLVRQADLGGIAIWALGYEGDAPELWEVIERKVE